MKLVIFCFIFSVSSSLDSDCSKGPDFWCKDFSNAQKCGKVAECFKGRKILNNKISQNSLQSGFCCSLCLKIEAILNKKLENIPKCIEFVTREVCAHLPDETKSVCKLLLADYGSMVCDAMKVGLKRHAVCELLTFCDSNTLFRREGKNVPRFDSSEGCATCKEVFQLIQFEFEKTSPGELKRFLETFICNHLPREIQSTWQVIVDGYSSQIYELIKTLINADGLCSLIEACSVGFDPSQNSWSCETCIDMATVFTLTLDVPELEVKQYILSLICTKMSFIPHIACISYTSRALEAYRNEMTSHGSPTQFCVKYNMCSSSKPFSHAASKNVHQLSPLTPSFSGTSWNCEVCIDLFIKFKQHVVNVTESDVESFVKSSTCAKMIFYVIPPCNKYVSKVIPVLYSDIQSSETPWEICDKYKVCPSFRQYGVTKLPTI